MMVSSAIRRSNIIRSNIKIHMFINNKTFQQNGQGNNFLRVNISGYGCRKTDRNQIGQLSCIPRDKWMYIKGIAYVNTHKRHAQSCTHTPHTHTHTYRHMDTHMNIYAHTDTHPNRHARTHTYSTKPRQLHSVFYKRYMDKQ